MELLLVWLVAAAVTVALGYGFIVLLNLAIPFVGPAIQALGCIGPVAGIPVFAICLAAALSPLDEVHHPILVAVIITPLAVITGIRTLEMFDKRDSGDLVAIPVGAAAIGVETVLVTLAVNGLASAARALLT